MTWCIFKDGDSPVDGIEYLLYWYDDEYGHTQVGFKYNTKHEATKTAERLFGTNGFRVVRMFRKTKRPGTYANYTRERY